MSRLYVYALVEAQKARLRQSSLEIVPAGDLFAVVERLEAPPAVTEANLRRQHAIVETIAAAVDAILPVRFGSLVDPDQLDVLVSERRAALHDAFDLVRGREQMTVRLFGARPRRERPARGRRRGRDYLLDRIRATTVDPLAGRVRAPVKALIAAERLEEGRGTLRISIHHLVSRGTAAQYGSLVGQAIAHLPASVSARVSGPWPPYAFVPILLK